VSGVVLIIFFYPVPSVQIKKILQPMGSEGLCPNKTLLTNKKKGGKITQNTLPTISSQAIFKIVKKLSATLIKGTVA
jgi:hypothetical protein